MEENLLFIFFVAYIGLGRCVVHFLGGPTRDVLFAALNLAAVYLVLFHGVNDNYIFRFVVYLGLVAFQYGFLHLFAQRDGWLPWIAFFAPIGALVFFRYAPTFVYVELGRLLGKDWQAAPTMIGISYLAFRSSQLVLEVRNRVVPKPSLFEYLGFCFFLPTVPAGPINPYSNYRRAFTAERPDIPVSRAAMRILVGMVKYQFLGSLCNRLSYSGLMLDEHPHPWMDLPVAMIFYYLFLYCNFSGFCDMAIGAAGLMGIPVAENFDRPLSARNMKEFWNRWHITLSQYMRDLVFVPFSKYLTRILGPDRVNHAIAMTIFVVFLLIGIWHGVGWNYAAFGVAQALGVIVTHYYTIGLKKRLGREAFRAYNAHRGIRAAAVAITFCYYAATLFLFANTFPEMKQIISVLRW